MSLPKDTPNLHLLTPCETNYAPICQLPDGSAFFILEVDTKRGARPGNPIHWNPGNKVVQNHRTGDIIQPDTDIERAKRGLPVPWKPDYAERETRMGDIP